MLVAVGFCNKGRVSLGSLLLVALEEILAVHARNDVGVAVAGTAVLAPPSPPKAEAAAAATV